MMSGGRIKFETFARGWFLHGWGKAHYFVLQGDRYRALCGVVFEPKLHDALGPVAFEPGNFPRCTKCQHARARK